MAEATQKKAFKQFLNLVVVAYHDGKIEENELAFLRRKQRELGISEDEARRVFSLVVGGQRDFGATGSSEERLGLLNDVVELALADGVLQQGEYEKVLELAAKVGASAEDLDKAIARVANRLLQESAPRSEGLPSWLVNVIVILAIVGGVAFLDLRFFWRG